MKKYLILITILIIISFFIKIPKYNELNNLVIIDKIKITCQKNSKKVSIREVEPLKEDNGITYKYNYYKEEINDIKNLKTTYKNKYHKQFYYNKTNKLITNCNNIEEIKNILDINPKKIEKN